jgi:cholesterol transport system auxiliary component
MIVEYLEAKELFKATIPSLSLAQSDLVLESDLNNFEQVFKEGNSYVHVKIRFRLVQRAEAKVLGTISFEEKITPKGESTQDVVEAFNVGINKIMQNLSIWISETI